jgi:hypothetical protein
MKNKVILFCPGGRKNILSIQLLYILKILDLDIVFEYHVWDFSWNKEDSEYISQLQNIHPKLKIKYSPYINASRAGEVASKQFSYFLSDYYKFEIYYDYIFIKLDDDICFIDINNFEKFIDGRIKSNSFLYSANVINNNYLAYSDFDYLNNDFINNYDNILKKNNIKNSEIFSNEKRLSINFVSFLGKDLKYINKEFSNGIGSNDEWRLCHTIPKMLGRDNEICLFMTVVHYAYGGYINPKYLNNYINIERIITR